MVYDGVAGQRAVVGDTLSANVSGRRRSELIKGDNDVLYAVSFCDGHFSSARQRNKTMEASRRDERTDAWGTNGAELRGRHGASCVLGVGK